MLKPNQKTVLLAAMVLFVCLVCVILFFLLSEKNSISRTNWEPKANLTQQTNLESVGTAKDLVNLGSDNVDYLPQMKEFSYESSYNDAKDFIASIMPLVGDSEVHIVRYKEGYEFTCLMQNCIIMAYTQRDDGFAWRLYNYNFAKQKSSSYDGEITPHIGSAIPKFVSDHGLVTYTSVSVEGCVYDEIKAILHVTGTSDPRFVGSYKYGNNCFEDYLEYSSDYSDVKFVKNTEGECSTYDGKSFVDLHGIKAKNDDREDSPTFSFGTNVATCIQNEYGGGTDYTVAYAQPEILGNGISFNLSLVYTKDMKYYDFMGTEKVNFYDSKGFIPNMTDIYGK